MILCGWCGNPTDPAWRCVSCGRDALLPYLQRGQTPEPVDPHGDKRRLLAEAERALGPDATIERIAAYLERDPRTIRRWQAAVRVMSAPRPRTPPDPI